MEKRTIIKKQELLHKRKVYIKKREFMNFWGSGKVDIMDSWE